MVLGPSSPQGPFPLGVGEDKRGALSREPAPSVCECSRCPLEPLGKSWSQVPMAIWLNMGPQASTAPSRKPSAPADRLLCAAALRTASRLPPRHPLTSPPPPTSHRTDFIPHLLHLPPWFCDPRTAHSQFPFFTLDRSGPLLILKSIFSSPPCATELHQYYCLFLYFFCISAFFPQSYPCGHRPWASDWWHRRAMPDPSDVLRRSPTSKKLCDLTQTLYFFSLGFIVFTIR